jgi:hypothetical protein
MLEHFRPLLDAAHDLDLSDTAAAEALLTERFDPASPAGQALNAKLIELWRAGKLADQGKPPMNWGRVTKPAEESLGFSIDVVVMSGAGPRHRHPKGEIDYCVAIDGDPTFDGRNAGWVVLGPGSEHVPTAAGGQMLIAYLLPDGAFEFVK